MPRKKRSTRRTPEPLTRFIDITSVRAAVSVGVVQDLAARSWIHGALVPDDVVGLRQRSNAEVLG